jgi:predicted component of type VI protein secretion system
MTMLRLFLQSEPFLQIEERQLEKGELVIGRAKDVDWPLADPARLLSRRHCSIMVADGAVSLRDTSANGVFIGTARERVRSTAPVHLKPGETVRLGEYIIVVEANDQVQASASRRNAQRPLLRPVENPAAANLAAEHCFLAPGSLADPGAATLKTASPGDDAAALDAFCEGAHLDPLVFVDEDPSAVMRRLGAVYREMVLGLTDLMEERTAVKADYRMDRTAIRPADNNPFRWAGAQRVALDLLRDRQDGFLSGPHAVRSAFTDVKKHLLCVFAGAGAALGAVLQALSPKVVEAGVPARDILLKGRGAATWGRYVAAHTAYQRDAAQSPNGLSNREFSIAYGRRLEELDAGEQA